MTAVAASWTPDEDAILRAHRLSTRAADLTGPTGRSKEAIYKRSARLGLIRYRRWTAEDNARLRRLWDSDLPLQGIATKLGRTPATTYCQAQDLGLPLGVPDRHEYLTASATRTGYDVKTLRLILAWAEVPVRRVRGRPTGARRGMHYCEPFDVDEAIERWHRTEVVTSAARARGLVGETLRRWLLEAGHKPPEGFKSRWRLESAEIDRVIAGRGLSVREAARLCGVGPDTLGKWLRAAGVPRNEGRVWRISIEEARRVIDAKRAGKSER